MNLSASLSASRDQAVKDAQRRDVTMVTFLASLCIIGVLVNSLLLDVYLHTRRKVLSTYFITAVAAIDLIVSAVAMPLRILPVITQVSAQVCALCMSVSYGCIGVSIMLFFCITFDRFQSVCLLQRPLITTQNLHFAGSWAFVSAVYAGIIAPLYLKGEITILDEYSTNISSSNITGSGETVREVTFLMRPDYMCYSTSLLSHPLRVWDARYIVQFIFAMCCGSLIVLVLALYVVMFIKLRQKDHFRLQSMSQRGLRETPRELTARPCCDMGSIPALTKRFQRRPSSDKDGSHSATGDLSLDSEDIIASLKGDSGYASEQNKTTDSQRQKNATSKSALFYKTNPYSMAAGAADGSHRGKHFAILARSVSSLQMMDLLKFRRRLRHKVQPLEYPGTEKASKPVGSPRNKLTTGYISAAFNCFGDINQDSDLDTGSSENVCTQFASDTDSICSEPETSRKTLDIDPQKDKTLIKIIKEMEDIKFASRGTITAELLERQRSFSCSSVTGAARRCKDRRSRIIKDHQTCEEPVENRGLEKSLNDEQVAVVSKNLTYESEITRESFVNGHKSLYSDPPNDAVKQTSLSDSSGSNSITNQQQASETSYMSQTIGVNVTDTSAIPILTITVQSKSYHGPHNSTEHCVNLSKTSQLSGVDGLDAIQSLKTEITIAKDGPTAGDCDLSQHKKNTDRLTNRQHRGWWLYCAHHEWNLSTRVTARVGLLTLAYCMWWMPFYLTELGLVDYGTLMPEIFFMANVMNPLLHLLTSQIFRYQMRARLRAYMTRLSSLWSPPTSSKA